MEYGKVTSNLLISPFRWTNAFMYSSIFSRQAKGVPAHWVQHLQNQMTKLKLTQQYSGHATKLTTLLVIQGLTKAFILFLELYT